MKLAFIIALSVAAASASAAQYSGKKFKITITKTEQGRVVEGEVWDTTRSEHIFLLHTQAAQPAPSVAPVEPGTARTEDKMQGWK